MSARIISAGKVVQLDAKRGPDVVFTPADVQDARKLSDTLTLVVADQAEVKRRHKPEFIDFEDVAVPGSGSVTLPHGLGGRVRWWLVDWQPSSTGTRPALEKDGAKTTTGVLVLKSAAAGTATVRVEKV